MSRAFRMFLYFVALLPLWLAAPAPVSAGPGAPSPTKKQSKGKKKVKKSKQGKSPGSAKNEAATIPGRLSNRPTMDGDSLLAKHLSARSVRAKGSIASFGGKKVALSDGQKVRISEIAPVLFEDHDKLDAELSRATGKAGGLHGGLSVTDEAYELPHAIVLQRTTVVVVDDPVRLRTKSPLFREVKFEHKGTMKVSQLSREARKGFDEFKTKELPSLPKDHPLRVAATKGDDALLNAVLRGVGDLTVTDTFVVPKVAPKVVGGRLQTAPLNNGVSDYSKRSLEPLRALPKLPDAAAAMLDQHAPALDRAVQQSEGHSRIGGVRAAKTEFLNGFTVADDYKWEKTWKFTSGLFRVTVGADYAFGLRIPIEVETRMMPSWQCGDGPKSGEGLRRFNLDVKARALDAGPEYYRRVGLDGAAVADGKEVAFEGGVSWGYKFRIAWETVGSRNYSRVAGFDYGWNFEPPVGARMERIGSFFIPASLTRTHWSAGPLHASIKFGFRLYARGEIVARLSPKKEGRNLQVLGTIAEGVTPVSGTGIRGPFTLSFLDTNTKSLEIGLPGYGVNKNKRNAHFEENYGFSLQNIEYRSKWDAAPGVQISASARVSGLGYEYGFGWTKTIFFSNFRIPLGELTLNRHSGTTRSYNDFEGLRVYHQNTAGDGPDGYCAETFRSP